MNRPRPGFVGLGVGLLLVFAVPAGAAGPPAKAGASDAQALADRIDELIAARWAVHGVKPAPRAGDAEFLRRAYLDLAGKIPPAWVVREFLADARPDKRQRLIDQLLDGPHYVRNFTHVWRAVLLPDAANVRFMLPSFEAWLRQRLADDTPYDRFVRELLTLPLVNDQRQNINFNAAVPSALAFYQASELKAENLAAGTSRLFLGVKLECAQCHDHPFATWKRKQFWEFAAFFAGIKATNGNVFGRVEEEADRHELTIPGTDKVVQARLLDGAAPKWRPKVSARTTLADWVTAADNPFFARAAVNRLWAHFFGVGLVEPDEHNPPSHPELLDELARQLAAHRFDLKFPMRAIALSQAYQRSSAARVVHADEARLFARMAVRGLTPEQLFDSLAQATGYREPADGPRPFFAAQTPRGEFLARFSGQDKRTEFQTSILQALMLMNGKFVADATSVDRSELLVVVLDAPFLDDPARQVEALYLATLSRKPRPEELSRMVQYVKRAGSKKERKLAVADVYWSLLNSSEFILNH
jgi:hypothetical protein